jgi:TAG lipase / steryl ester hydrolase / phospholipase A2 / LPA acyltransferase
MTFREAYESTGFILNISVTGYVSHDSYRVLNYFTAPHVLIWSAAMASACVPNVYSSTPIYW